MQPNLSRHFASQQPCASLPSSLNPPPLELAWDPNSYYLLFIRVVVNQTEAYPRRPCCLAILALALRLKCTKNIDYQHESLNPRI